MQQRLSVAVDEYLKYRRAGGLAKSTLENDKTNLGKLKKHTRGDMYVHNIKEKHITEVLTIMSETRSPRTMGITHTVFNKFFEWACRTKRMPKDDNPMDGYPRPKWHKTQRDRLSVTQFNQLLDAAKHPVDRIVIALGLYLMIRVSEIRTIRLSDLLLPHDEIHVKIHKSGKDDFMPISAELMVELRRWLTFYTQEVGELKPHYFLAPSKSRPIPTPNPDGGRPIMDVTTCRLVPERKLGRTASRTVRVALEAIGFPVYNEDGKLKGEGTHTLRRSGARAMFDAAREAGYDGSLRRVQAMLHHAQVTDTEHYIGTDLDTLERNEAIAGKTLFTQVVEGANVTHLHVPGSDNSEMLRTFAQ